MPPLQQIRAFVRLEEGIGTAGMPRPEHFSEIARAGYRVVINLAMPNSDNAVANEGELATREGMTYIHIPVRFDAPSRQDYERFEQVLEVFRAEPVFVHCAANMRVSAFMFLYRLRKSVVPRPQAETDLLKIWTPDTTWRRFINELLPPGQAPLT